MDQLRSAPVIVVPRAVGARPGHPLRLRVGSLGQNPIQVSVQDLPDGLEFDPARRLVTGMVPSAGIHPLRVSAVNAQARSEVEVQLTSGPAISAECNTKAWEIGPLDSRPTATNPSRKLSMSSISCSSSSSRPSGSSPDPIQVS